MSNEAEADQWRVRAVNFERTLESVRAALAQAKRDLEECRQASAHQHEQVARAGERAHWEKERSDRLTEQVLVAARERDEARKALAEQGRSLEEVKAARERDLAAWEARSAEGREQVARLQRSVGSLREDLAQARLERDGALETIDRLSPEAVNRMKDELATANTRVAALERDYFRVRGERDVARDELRQEASDGLALAARLEEAREDAEAWRQTSLAASLRTDEMRVERDELLGQRAVRLDQAVIDGLVVGERASWQERLEHALESERLAREECARLEGERDELIEKFNATQGPSPWDEVQPENFEAIREAFEERLDALEEAAARHYGVPEQGPSIFDASPDEQRMQRERQSSPNFLGTVDGLVQPGEWRSMPPGAGTVNVRWERKDGANTTTITPADGAVLDSEPVTAESLQRDEDRFTRSVRQHADGALGEYVEHRMAQRVVRDFASTARRWDRYLTRHE